MFRTLVLYSLLVVGCPLWSVTGQHPKCDLKLYTSPYVRVMRKRNGPPIAERTSRDFLDLREQIHRMLCINGPVILYEDHRRAEKFKNQFTKAKMKFYTHECVIINQIKTSKVMELRARGIDRPTLKDVDYWDIVGQRATGIFLLAKSNDYTQPVATFFTTDNLEFLQGNDTGVNHGSFATIGVGPFCLRVDNSFDIIVGGMPSPKSVCQWSFTGSGASKGDMSFRKRYHKIFNGQLRLKQFTWTVCGGASGLGPFPVIPPTTTEATVVYDPFAIMNPSVEIPAVTFESLQKKAIKLSQSSPHKSLLHDKSHNVFLNHHQQDDYDVDYPPDLIVVVNPSDCITIPDKPTSVPPNCGAPSDAITCLLFDRALDIPQKPGATVSDPTNPPSLDRELTWKRDILYIVSEIFGQICKPFPPDLAYTVGRLFEYYVARAHEADPDIPLMARDKWKYVTSELSRCMINVKKSNYKMLWYWDNRDDRETFGPEETEKPGDMFLDIGIPSCKAMECSAGCVAEDDKCVPLPEFSAYCFYLGIHHCYENVTLCYINGETGTCDLGLECEAKKCQGDEIIKCVTEGDTCMETYERDNFIPDKSRKRDEESPNSDTTGPQNEAESGGIGLGDEPPLPPIGNETEPTPKEAEAEDEKVAEDLVVTATTAAAAPPTFHKVQVQEVFPVLTEREWHFDGYPVNVMSISGIWEDQVLEDPGNSDPELESFSFYKRQGGRQPRSPRKPGSRMKMMKKKKKPTTMTGECLFFYEEAAEIHYELNVAIDVFWKIYATVLGYCNREYPERKSETFPSLYSMFVEDFLDLVMEEWRFPKENEALKSILSEVNSEVGQRWLDVCLESSYLVSNSSTYRPPRPLHIGDDKVPQSNYFLTLPEYLTEQYLWQPDVNFTMVSCPY